MEVQASPLSPPDSEKSASATTPRANAAHAQNGTTPTHAHHQLSHQRTKLPQPKSKKKHLFPPHQSRYMHGGGRLVPHYTRPDGKKPDQLMAPLYSPRRSRADSIETTHSRSESSDSDSCSSVERMKLKKRITSQGTKYQGAESDVDGPTDFTEMMGELMEKSKEERPKVHAPKDDSSSHPPAPTVEDEHTHAGEDSMDESSFSPVEVSYTPRPMIRVGIEKEKADRDAKKEYVGTAEAARDQDELKALKIQLAAAEQETQKQKMEKDALKEQLELAKVNRQQIGETSPLKPHIEFVKSEVTKTRQELEKLVREHKKMWDQEKFELKKKNAELSATLEILKENERQRAEEDGDTTRLLEDANAELASMRAQRRSSIGSEAPAQAAIEQQLESAAFEIIELKAKLQKTATDHEAEIRIIHKQQESEISNLNKQHQTDLFKLKETQRVAIRNIDNEHQLELQRNLDVLSHDQGAMDLQVERQRNEITNLKGAMETLESLYAREKDVSQREIKVANAELVVKEHQLDARDADNASLRSIIDSKDSELAAKHDQISVLQKKVLQNQETSATITVEELRKVTAQLATKEAEMEAVRAREKAVLDAFEKENQKLRSEMEDLRHEAAHDSTLILLDNEIQRNKAEVAALRHELDLRRGQIKSARKTVETIELRSRNDLAKMSTEKAALAAGLQALQAQPKDTSKELALNKELAQIKAELQTARNASSAVATDKAMMQNTIKFLQSEIAKLQNQIDSLTAKPQMVDAATNTGTLLPVPVQDGLFDDSFFTDETSLTAQQYPDFRQALSTEDTRNQLETLHKTLCEKHDEEIARYKAALSKLVKNKSILRKQALKASATLAAGRHSPDTNPSTTTVAVDEAELNDLKERLAVAESEVASTTSRLLAIQRENDELMEKMRHTSAQNGELVVRMTDQADKAKEAMQSLRDANALVVAQTAAEMRVREAEWNERLEHCKKECHLKMKRERSKRREAEGVVFGVGLSAGAVGGTFKHSCRTRSRPLEVTRGAAKLMRRRGGSLGTTATCTEMRGGGDKENIGVFEDDSMEVRDSEELSDAELY